MSGINPILSYKDLTVWKRAIEVVIETYKLTEKFPKSELYSLTLQMRRAAISIPSNIAEGRRSGTRKEFRKFLVIALGSSFELETQIEITKQLPLGKDLNYVKIDQVLLEVMKMLQRMIANLKKSSS